MGSLCFKPEHPRSGNKRRRKSPVDQNERRLEPVIQPKMELGFAIQRSNQLAGMVVSSNEVRGSRRGFDYGTQANQECLLMPRSHVNTRIGGTCSPLSTIRRTESAPNGPSAETSMGIAIMRSQRFVGLPALSQDMASRAQLTRRYQHMETSNLEMAIQKAKADAKTVSIVDGYLYIDYKFVARLPPGMKVTN